jgi:predicted glutamine amidotransferase
MLALTGYVTTVKDILVQFQPLCIHGKCIDSTGHRDGWGIGYYNDSITLVKKAECAVDSAEYQKTVEAINDDVRILLAHVRKASPGTRITDKEAHPFQKNNFLFCHNGSILQQDGSPLRELDSIVYFKKILETSLKNAVQHFWDFTYTSLTCLLTDGATVWAYRDCTEKKDYYTLYYLQTEMFVLFCSEPLIKGEWVLLKNRELVTVFPDRSVTTELLY